VRRGPVFRARGLRGVEEAFPGQNASGKGPRRGLRARGGLECVNSSQISRNTRRKGAFLEKGEWQNSSICVQTVTVLRGHVQR